MRLLRGALVLVLLAVLAVAIQQTLLWLGMGGDSGDSQVRPLDNEDEEIALIEPATSIDDWGRIVTAARLIELDWPKYNPTLPALRVGLTEAFPTLTTDVPEIVFSFVDFPANQLRVRWYKISGEHDAGSWVRKLRAREHPPLAILGGGTSDRAVRLARALQKTYPDPEESSPVLLITTATADRTAKDDPLIEIYPERSFRFSFTNQKMVAALLEFAQRRKYPKEAKEWGAGNLWCNQAMEFSAPAEGISMHAISWQDERYSTDMSALFENEFPRRFPQGKFSNEGSIPSGVGGFFHPAPPEQIMVQTFLTRPTPIAPHSFLVLPTQTVRMRRFLINLRQRSEKDARNLVVLNGDGVTFHSIYRDRDVMWNVLDLPYSLVFFAHRNPIDRHAGFREKSDDRSQTPDAFPPRGTSGTHDLLLYRDVFEALLYAGYDRGRWIGDAVRLRDRLRATCWYHPPLNRIQEDPPRVCNSEVHAVDPKHRPLFDAAGNRRSRTGEHIVWLKPSFTEDRVDLRSTISVWTIDPDLEEGIWQLSHAFPAYYNQSRLEGGQP